MQRVPEKPAGGFSTASLTNLLAIPIATGAITLLGFYYGTNATLQRQSDDIKDLKSKVELTSHAVTKKTDEDSAARTKIRDDFLASQIKTNEGIGKLDTRLAVAETQQATANQQLTKISDTLEKISSSFRKKGD